MTIEQIGEFYVFYILPTLKVFALVVIVLAVFAFWALIRRANMLDLCSQAFNGIMHYLYISVVFVGMSIWYVVCGVGRMFNAIFATVRDFFISRG